MGSSRRRVLNQSTHSRVANSTASKERHGPRRWITSALKRPLIVSARALSVAVTDAADGRLDTGLDEPLRVADRQVLRAPVAMMHEAATPDRTTLVQGLLQGIQHEAGMSGLGHTPADDATGEDVDHEGHIDEAAPGRDVGEVRDPTGRSGAVP